MHGGGIQECSTRHALYLQMFLLAAWIITHPAHRFHKGEVPSTSATRKRAIGDRFLGTLPPPACTVRLVRRTSGYTEKLGPELHRKSSVALAHILLRIRNQSAGWQWHFASLFFFRLFEEGLTESQFAQCLIIAQFGLGCVWDLHVCIIALQFRFH